MTFTAQTSGVAKCVAAGTYTFYCPDAAGLSTELLAQEAYLQCKVCGATFTDTDESTGSYAGVVYWGPNMLNGVVDESFVDYYAIVPVDDCGIPQSNLLGWVGKKTPAATCCDNMKYSATITLSGYSKIMVAPGSYPSTMNFLNDGVVIDLVDATTTTTTSGGMGGGISGASAMQMAPITLLVGQLAVFN